MIDLAETARVKGLLEQQPEKFEDIIEQTPLAICVTDEQGKFSGVNDNYCRLYGYAREEMLGKSFLMVVPQERQDFLQEQHDMFIKFKDEIMRNWEVQGKDGVKFKIFADAGYNPVIKGSAHKVTFIWPVEPERQEGLQAKA